MYLIIGSLHLKRKLLQEGPKSLAQAWHLQALKYRYESTTNSRDVED